MRRLIQTLALCLCLAPLAAAAQQLAFGGIKADTTAPVEIVSDTFAVDQTDGTATFTGNVIVVQGDMRLQAETVVVDYVDNDNSRIDRLHATGGVTLVSASDAAESAEAIYEVAAGRVTMTGNVLLTQGANVMSGQRLTVDLNNGTGQMEGRVRTILQPGGN